MWNKEWKFLLKSFSPYTKFRAIVWDVYINWTDESKLYYNEHDLNGRKNVLESWLSIECDIRFINDTDSSQTQDTKITIPVFCETLFSLENYRLDNARMSLMNTEKKALRDYNESIFNYYREKGIDDKYLTINGLPLDNEFRSAMFTPGLSLSANTFDLWQELYLCLQRIRYCIATMASYHPYLDNPLLNKQRFTATGRDVFPSHASMYDERYFMYCEFTYQSLYNFWDRIGDILNEIVPTGLKSDKIYFSSVIEKINQNPNYNSNAHFISLLNLKNNYFSSINQERKKLVHYETISSAQSKIHLTHFADQAEIEKRQLWINSRVNESLVHFQKCIEGIQQLILFTQTK